LLTKSRGDEARERWKDSKEKGDESGRKLARWHGRTPEIVKREDEVEMKEGVHARGEEREE